MSDRERYAERSSLRLRKMGIFGRVSGYSRLTNELASSERRRFGSLQPGRRYDENDSVTVELPAARPYSIIEPRINVQPEPVSGSGPAGGIVVVNQLEEKIHPESEHSYTSRPRWRTRRREHSYERRRQFEEAEAVHESEADHIRLKAIVDTSLQIFGVVLAILFGIFSILAWTSSVQANRDSTTANQLALLSICMADNTTSPICDAVLSAAGTRVSQIANSAYGQLLSGAAKNKSGLSTGAKIGIGIGVPAAILLICFILFSGYVRYLSKKLSFLTGLNPHFGLHESVKVYNEPITVIESDKHSSAAWRDRARRRSSLSPDRRSRQEQARESPADQFREMGTPFNGYRTASRKRQGPADSSIDSTYDETRRDPRESSMSDAAMQGEPTSPRNHERVLISITPPGTANRKRRRSTSPLRPVAPSQTPTMPARGHLRQRSDPPSVVPRPRSSGIGQTPDAGNDDLAGTPRSLDTRQPLRHKRNSITSRDVQPI